jgi:hypothetical protein
MSRRVRHLVNALVCLVVAAYAVYWFATGRAQFATGLQVSLAAAAAVVGLAGAAWFFLRARNAHG